MLTTTTGPRKRPNECDRVVGHYEPRGRGFPERCRRSFAKARSMRGRAC
jgi:hypothetical protein